MLAMQCTLPGKSDEYSTMHLLKEVGLQYCATALAHNGATSVTARLRTLWNLVMAHDEMTDQEYGLQRPFTPELLV